MNDGSRYDLRGDMNSSHISQKAATQWFSVELKRPRVPNTYERDVLPTSPARVHECIQKSKAVRGTYIPPKVGQ